MGKESIVTINDHQYRYEYVDGKTVYRGPVGDAPEISELTFLAHMKKRIMYEDILEYDQEHGTSFIREMEMTVEIGAKPIEMGGKRYQNLPLVQQFFKDLKLYGLGEAIAYVEGYEIDGEYEEGTTKKLREIQKRFMESRYFEMKPSLTWAERTWKCSNCGGRTPMEYERCVNCGRPRPCRRLLCPRAGRAGTHQCRTPEGQPLRSIGGLAVGPADASAATLNAMPARHAAPMQSP